MRARIYRVAKLLQSVTSCGLFPRQKSAAEKEIVSILLISVYAHTSGTTSETTSDLLGGHNNARALLQHGQVVAVSFQFHTKVYR